jgi:hypothetical protein
VKSTIHSLVKFPDKTPLNTENTLRKMKDRNVKQVLLWVLVGGKSGNGEDEGGQTWSMYFIYMHENC